jgi:hypothetical protein
MIGPGSHWILAFAMKILGWIILLDLIVLPILWIFKTLYIFTFVLIYEAIFISIVGVFQILGSRIYREDSIPYRMGLRTGWFDFRKFSKLKQKERQRYRQEGIVMLVIGVVLLAGTLIAHFYILLCS